MRILAEIAINIGRIYLITEHATIAYIFELNLNQGAQIALTQAERKRYQERFSHPQKKTLVMGINFSSKSRNISDWKGVLYSGSEKIKAIFPKGGEQRSND